MQFMMVVMVSVVVVVEKSLDRVAADTGDAVDAE